MKRVDGIPIIYAPTNTNEKECDLVQDLGGNKFQICRKPESILKKSSQSYPEFIPAKSINYSSNNTFGNAVNIQISNPMENTLGGRDPWFQSNNSLTYQSNSANLAIKACNDENSFNYLKQQTKFDHSNQKLGDNEIKHIANVIKTGELPNLKILDLHGNDFGLEGMLALLDMMESPNVVSLTVILACSKQFDDTVIFLDKVINYYIAEYVKRNNLPETYVVSDKACLNALSIVGKNTFIGLIKCLPLLLKKHPGVFICMRNEYLDPDLLTESVGCIAKTNDFLKSFHQEETKEINSIQEQEKHKSDKWSKDYMDSLVNQGANDPNHAAYSLFSKAYGYASCKSKYSSKPFFSHYMDSLVNQGANNPQHPYYHLFANAHTHALHKQTQQSKLTQSFKTTQLTSTLPSSFKNEIEEKQKIAQTQEKQKSDRWAKNYMDSLVNQGGSDSSHPAYYLFSNAYTYALSKSTDTSKSFFAHYMDSLANQGAGNPQHPYYYMFANAHTYALKNQ